MSSVVGCPLIPRIGHIHLIGVELVNEHHGIIQVDPLDITGVVIHLS